MQQWDRLNLSLENLRDEGLRKIMVILFLGEVYPFRAIAQGIVGRRVQLDQDVVSANI